MCSILGYTGTELSQKDIKYYFERTKTRGPDDTKIVDTGKGFLAFH